MRIMLNLLRALRSLRDREEGQVMPMFAAGLGAMVILTGVVVDGGNLFQNRQSLQNAADAAAIAAALEVAHGNCTPASTSACATYAGRYAGLNGDGSSAQQLNPCPKTVNETKPPATPPGCYVYPYTPPGAASSAYVEVWLTQKTSNFFGGLFPGFGTSTESARAVGTVTSGNPPPITFAALDPSCEAHTLLIKSSGNLTVDSGIYVNSCNDHDGFDVFAANNKVPPVGSITAPNIYTTGGWEVDDGTGVFVGAFPNPPECILTAGKPLDGQKTKIFAPPPGSPTGCPTTGVAAINDPFALFPPAPPLGSGNVVSILKIRRAGNVASVVVPGDQSGISGGTVTISGVGFNFDGTFPVTNAAYDSGTFTTTLTYANNGSALPAIINEQMVGGVATLTTNAPTTLSTSGPDTNVTVSGINSFFNLGASVTAPSSSGTTSSFSYPSTYKDMVSKMGLQQGTATLTVFTTANLTKNTSTMTVTGVDPSLDTPSNTPVTLTGVGAGTISYADPATMQLSVTNKAISNGTTATLTTSGNNHVFANDPVGVTVALGDPRFNGTYKTAALTAGPGTAAGTTFSYKIPAVTGSITNGDVSGGTFKLTTASGPPIEDTDTVTVNTGLLAYDGSGTVSNVNTTAHTFVYAPGPFQNSSWNFNLGNHTVKLTTASAHGLQVGDVITVTGFTNALACMNVTKLPVLTVPSATTFTYQAPTTCAPGGNGTQKSSITLVTASHALSGTVSLTAASIPVSPACVNCVTAPAYIAANSSAPANGSATLWDSPSAAAPGTAAFSPSWMPTSGEADLPGSPGNPFPTEISVGSGNVTLQPGTYYGGICIGAPANSDCSNAGKTPNCTAVGGTTTTTQSYTPPIDLAADVPANFDPTGSGDITVTQAGISTGDVIAINDEEMTVTAVSSDGLTITVTREANGTEDAMHLKGTPVFQVVTTQNGKPYNPAVTVNAPAGPGNKLGGITATQTTVPIQWPGQANTDPVQVNDVIQIGDELMSVTSETKAAGSKATLTVTRAWSGTTAAPHADKSPVLQGSSSSVATGPSVTLEPGVYIMAGGGFSVCGAGSVSVDTSQSPFGVMIYNTQDPAPHNTGYGALGQVDINTSGNVHLHPMTTGIYTGMTIFEDRSLALQPGAGCPHQTSSGWDIAFQSAGALPSSGELGSITGGIYAPSLHATFGDTMSGTSNLEVITSCFYLDGATSTFTHDTSGGGLPGVTATLGG